MSQANADRHRKKDPGGQITIRNDSRLRSMGEHTFEPGGYSVPMFMLIEKSPVLAFTRYKGSCRHSKLQLASWHE